MLPTPRAEESLVAKALLPSAARALPGLAPASPEELGFCPRRTERLCTVLQSEVDRQRLPGAVAFVARRGGVVLNQAFGLQDPAVGSPMRTDSIFRIYSMTKPIVSMAAMMLVEQGRLLLGDPVARYLPEFGRQQVARAENGTVQLQAVRQGATVQDLMRHTAGLTYEFLGAGPVHRQYAQSRIGSRDRSNEAFSLELASLPLLFEPGTAWEYGRATDVLGRVVEVVSGLALSDCLQTQIFEPLGMTETAFSVPPTQHHRIAEPFARDPEGGVLMKVFDVREPAALQSGGGGLASTAWDYARFLQCLLNRGELDGARLLGSRTVDFMTADHLGDIPVFSLASRALLPQGHGFGLGFAVRKDAGLASVPGSVGSYFWGGMAGTTFFVDPAEDMFAILMLQAPNQREYYRMLFRNLIYAALID